MLKSGEHQEPAPDPIGRNAELRLLSSSFESASAGRGRVVLISGEAGVGKTTLVEHFLAGPLSSELPLLRGSCYDVSSPAPYAAWRSAFASLVENEFDSLDSLLWLDDADLTRLPDQNALFHVAFDRLRQHAEDSPMVVLLEDIHWADRESLELLRFVARRLRDLPVLVIATYRDDEITSGHPLYDALLPIVQESRAERLELRRLSKPAILEMVRRHYDLVPDDAERLAGELQERTEGNPLFIVEMLRSIEMAGAIRLENGRWILTPLTDVEIPLLVRQLIDRRLLQVEDEARSALQIAAILGFEVRPDLWLSVTGVDEATLARYVEQALDASLLEQSPYREHLRFRHALVREALYSSVPLPWRQLQHRRVGERLAEMPGVDPSVVADHYRRAGDPRSAWWSLRAAREARQLYAPHAVRQHVDAALEQEERLTLDELAEARRLRGWAGEISGDFESACRDFLAELEIASENGDTRGEWDALIRLAELWAGRDYTHSGEYIEKALHLAEELDDPALKAHSANRMGNWYLNREQPDRALEHHRLALDLFRGAGDQPGIAASEDLLGMAWILGGSPVDAASHYERAIDLFSLLDDREGLVSSLANHSMRGVTYQTDMMVPARTTLDECVADAERALVIASGIDYRAGVTYAQIRLGSCLGSRGEYQRSLDVLEAGLAVAEEIGHRQWFSAACCVAGTVYLDLLDAATARSLLERGRQAAENSGTIHWIRSNSGILALAYIALDDLELAEAELNSVDRSSAPVQTLAQRLIWRARIELELARHNPDKAVTLIDDVLGTTRHASRERPSIRLSLLRARALIALERSREALSWLEPAIAVAREQGALPLLWRLRREAGIAQARTGERVDSAREFEEAHRLIEVLGSGLDDASLRGRFLSAANELVPEPRSPTELQSAKRAFGGLTRRQREVAALVAAGNSNRAIADELSVSERTVESHITSILTTLNLRSRSQIAVWYVDQA